MLCGWIFQKRYVWLCKISIAFWFGIFFRLSNLPLLIKNYMSEDSSRMKIAMITPKIGKILGWLKLIGDNWAKHFVSHRTGGLLGWVEKMLSVDLTLVSI